jgi:hypothetical protein
VRYKFSEIGGPLFPEILRNWRPSFLEILRNWRPSFLEILRNWRPSFLEMVARLVYHHELDFLSTTSAETTDSATNVRLSVRDRYSKVRVGEEGGQSYLGPTGRASLGPPPPLPLPIEKDRDDVAPQPERAGGFMPLALSPLTRTLLYRCATGMTRTGCAQSGERRVVEQRPAAPPPGGISV